MKVEAQERFQKLETSYKTIEGKTCYRYYVNQHSDMVPIDREAISNYEIVDQKENEIVVRFSGVKYSFELIPTNGQCYVTLKKTDGKWKISNYDISELLLYGDETLMKTDTLSKEAVAESLRVAICNLYSMSFFPSEMWEDQILCGVICENGKIESLNNVETIEKYALAFCTENMKQKLLPLNGKAYMRSENGKLTFDSENASKYYVKNVSAMFVYSFYDPGRVKNIVTDNDTTTAYYQLTKDDVITVQYIKGDDGWRISGGNFVDEIDKIVAENRNANTGDGQISVAFISLTILATVIIGLYKTKKYEIN